MTTPETSPGTSPESSTTGQSRMSASTRSTLIGAIFLMATSAIGPGFITQTTAFTVELGAAFACAILVSILVDIALQMNVWRVIGVSGMRAQELGNKVLPGLGFVMAGLLLVGGFVFNVGNVAGAGLGFDAMMGLDPTIGGIISAAIAIAIFVSKRAGVAMDRIVLVLGGLMIVLTAYIAVTSGPPVGDALRNAVLPQVGGDADALLLATTTIIGGTVGGYIVYAGAHRLLDSGVQGPERVGEITRGSVIGILVTGVMRVVLFLAILGVVSQGVELDPENQAASAFQAAAGDVGMIVFGIVLWAAAITSVIGASYTTVSFVTSRTRTSDRTRTGLVIAFIALTTTIFAVAGAAPTTLLIFAGAFNGLLLPIGIGVMIWVAWARRDLLGGYAYPKWLALIGTAAWALTLYLAISSIQPVLDLF